MKDEVGNDSCEVIDENKAKHCKNELCTNILPPSGKGSRKCVKY